MQEITKLLINKTNQQVGVGIAILILLLIQFFLFEHIVYSFFFSFLPDKAVSLQEKNLIFFSQEPMAQRDYDSYLSQVEKYARSARFTLINNCAPRPLIRKVKKGSIVRFINTGKTTQILSFGTRMSIVIQPGEIKQIQLNQDDKGQQVLGYGCNGLRETAGILLTE